VPRRRTPLIAAVPKMLFPALVILPGMIAIALNYKMASGFLPKAADGSLNYNMAIPVMLGHYFPQGMLGLGLTALMASFMTARMVRRASLAWFSAWASTRTGPTCPAPRRR
jgi:SSS family solute:Na+ symporter